VALTGSDFLKVCDALVKRWAELVRADIQKDLDRHDSADIFDQAYFRAYWLRHNNLLLKLHEVHPKSEDPDEMLRLIYQELGDGMGVPSSELKVDVQSRLEWLKRRVAKEFEKEIKSLMDVHGVTSPIEQIFLMEWKFADVDDRHGVKLQPQKKVETARGEFAVDFLVYHGDDARRKLDFVIELDGHEFHEKTPQQATRDKARERAILRGGMPVLRFSGYEINRDARGCIREVEEYLAARKAEA
jgi:very-short-patch-repair endonuclease